MTTRGVFLGKFAPLHAGHQHVVDTALKAVDELVVLVYPTDLIDVPLDKRASWFHTVWPAQTSSGRLQIVACQDGPQEDDHTERVMRLQQDYVRGVLEHYGRATHFFSSEWYGEHMARALDAQDVRVDQGREAFPVSGTAIRKDPYAHRRQMHPAVYRDLIKKVVFLGAESTGKSTLAARMALEYGTVFVPEYGRTYWEKYNVGGKLTPELLADIPPGHLHLEDDIALEANRFLFVDTNALTTRIYSLHWHGVVHMNLDAFADHASGRYDYTFVCGDEFPYVEDGTREGPARRAQAQMEILDDLDWRGIKYAVLTGDVERRVAQVMKVIGGRQ